jgi:hypothetical protein
MIDTEREHEEEKEKEKERRGERSWLKGRFGINIHRIWDMNSDVKRCIKDSTI